MPATGYAASMNGTVVFKPRTIPINLSEINLCNEDIGDIAVSLKNLFNMLHINKPAVAQAIHDLAVANNVSDAQMASFIFRNFYESANHLRISVRIKRLSVAITNLTELL